MSESVHIAGGTGAPLVSVSGLTVSFDRHREEPIEAVRDVSWSIGSGEVLALVGESGSGKSVSALAVMGLLPRNARVAGSIRWRGEELLSASEKRRRALRGSRIGLVPQDPMTSLNPVYTIGAQIREGIRAHQKLSEREMAERTLELLETMGIPHARERMNSYPHELSGGMRQRVVIAMAMANNPDLIIADEATTALDVTVQAQVLDALKKAQALTGAALLLITHDLGVVAGRADRVAVMQRGEVVEQGTVDEIFYQPASSYTRKLLHSIPRLNHTPDLSAPSDVAPDAEVIHSAFERKVGAEGAPILSMRNVGKHFPVYSRGVIRGRVGVIKAVAGVDLDVEAGTTLGIVGESGSGKTTLIRSLFNLEPITHGTILFDGQDVHRMPPRDRRRMRKCVQMVFQDPYASLDPMMTVRDILMEPAVINRMDRKLAERRVMELLERVHLKPEHAARYPNEFSGGQRQRIAIARALMLHPRLLVLDEPVSSLDVSIQAEVLTLLKELQKDLNLSYLFVSHDLSVVAEIAHSVIVMYRGRIVERGRVDELFRNPKHPYTRALLSAVPIPDPRTERRRERIVFNSDTLASPITPVERTGMWRRLFGGRTQEAS
ncbi:ABC transporter ATP-binding protein [Chelativorans sp. J32]|uniref:ABC transporter ATP-binding protein n=1 Tax=Chelativorans sp. J32 TaxID=935840 RepID=UPI000487E344|nr:ABC transporter ATP-binding protein [Chelativorans sp. J32]